MKRGLIVVIGAAVALGSVSVWADEPSMAGDKADLQVLKARLEKLEKKIADQEAAAPAAGGSGGGLSPTAWGLSHVPRVRPRDVLLSDASDLYVGPAGRLPDLQYAAGEERSRIHQSASPPTGERTKRYLLLA